MDIEKLRRRRDFRCEVMTPSLSFSDRMKALFSRATSPKEGSISSKMRLPVQYSMAEIIQKVQWQLQDLLEAKERLSSEAGNRATSFIARYIDPVLSSVEQFLGESIKGKATVYKAVGGVELLSLIHNPVRLRQKICETIREQAYHVLQEDIAFLLSYPNELLKDEGKLKELEEQTYPLFTQLKALEKEVPLSTDFSELFRWRCCFDERRQALHDQIIQLVEESISQ